MRILQLRSSDIYGSPERLIIGQCRHLPQFEFVCASFCAGEYPNRFLKECQSAGLETAAIRDSFPGDPRMIARVNRVIAEHEIDLVVGHDYKSNFYTFLAPKPAETRHIGYFHGVTQENPKVKLYNAIDRMVLDRLKTVITVSERTRQQLVDRGLRADNIIVVPNAIDDSTLAESNRKAPGKSDPRRVMAAGRLSYEKGFDLLVEAVAKVRDGAPPFVLELYGSGPEETKLRAMINSYNLDDVIRMKGFVDNLLEPLRSADFLIMPSRSEGMPVTILEAWSQQLGVMATAVGGVPELIKDGVNGYLIEQENVDALAEQLSFGLANPEKLHECGKRGQQTVRQHYTFSAQAKLLAPIYQASAG